MRVMAAPRKYSVELQQRATRMAMEARKDPETPDAPTHASLVKAKYGDAEPRQPRPNANRGDNVTGGSPYQDTDEVVADAVASGHGAL